MSFSARSPAFLSNKRRSSQRILSHLEEFTGSFYKNVSHPEAFMVSVIYSKASIFFLCLIGSLTALNTLTFSSQLTETNVLCRFNYLLPNDKELRQIAIPIAYYCRFLEISIAASIFQLLFCLFALVYALNRRSYLFLLCYAFLGLMLFFGAILLIFILIVNFERYVYAAVLQMLHWLLNYESNFCQILEPTLNCRVYATSNDLETQHYTLRNETHASRNNKNIFSGLNMQTKGIENFDMIEAVCGSTRNLTHFGKPLSSVECSNYLTSFLMKRAWLISLIVEYSIILLMAFVAIVFAYKKRPPHCHSNATPHLIENKTSSMNTSETTTSQTNAENETASTGVVTSNAASIGNTTAGLTSELTVGDDGSSSSDYVGTSNTARPFQIVNRDGQTQTQLFHSTKMKCGGEDTALHVHL